MGKAKPIRVGFGTPSTPFSTAWRLWNHRREVYLAARSLGGFIKLSLHSSGIWRAAFTDESEVRVAGSGDRKFAEWERPAEFAPGWVLGPAVMVPRLDDRHDRPEPPRDPESVKWIHAPAIGHAAWLGVFFSKKGETSPATITSEITSIAGHLDLEGGERVWLAHSERQLERAEIADLTERRDKLTIHTSPREDRTDQQSDPSSGMGGSMLLFGASPLGVPMVTEMVLGSHLFAEEG